MRAGLVAAALLTLSVVVSHAPATACEACEFFLKSTHRTGPYALVVALDQSSYRLGKSPIVTVSVVNDQPIPMLLDTRVPIWQQSAFHINRVGHEGGSAFDVPIDRRHGKLLRPGATYTFEPVPLTRWGYDLEHRGVYQFALSYGKVDSNVVAFTVK
jgi:hypothetical protein